MAPRIGSSEPPPVNPEACVSSRETIYILAKEGAGSATHPPTALAVAIAEAMEKRAERHCGRLAPFCPG